jgi:hypothetical protein
MTIEILLGMYFIFMSVFFLYSIARWIRGYDELTTLEAIIGYTLSSVGIIAFFIIELLNL